MRRNPRFMPVGIFLAGLGIAGWYGMEWYELPQYSENEIEQSTDLNLAMDIARMGPHLKPEGEKLERLRAQVRKEVEVDLNRELKTAQLRFSVGLIAMVIGLAQFVFVVTMERLRR